MILAVRVAAVYVCCIASYHGIVVFSSIQFRADSRQSRQDFVAQLVGQQFMHTSFGRHAGIFTISLLLL